VGEGDGETPVGWVVKIVTAVPVLMVGLCVFLWLDHDLFPVLSASIGGPAAKTRIELSVMFGAFGAWMGVLWAIDRAFGTRFRDR
jgi:hypothetical protein